MPRRRTLRNTPTYTLYGRARNTKGTKHEGTGRARGRRSGWSRRGSASMRRGRPTVPASTVAESEGGGGARSWRRRADRAARRIAGRRGRRRGSGRGRMLERGGGAAAWCGRSRERMCT
ncbi:hypothetical protein BRADI_3g43366v3 [Brachypodium distachyon]|uniref:Uncharacterized protein n=1 Tax=Brachypodium distachyon TaxID=15368 RepID=A0A2K2D2X1_BRADI|nr:hypothetical protein BRADI_3g43366v3 [Brachypodium distachyon]